MTTTLSTSRGTAGARVAAVALHPAAVALWLVLLCFALHHRALGSGWHYDDPAHLNFIARYAPWQYFIVPEVMLEQSYAHITPWNAFFYDIGMPLFGLRARGHYIHLLLVLWAASFATFMLLRRWLQPGPALAGAALFLAMPATGVVGQLLMTGHYAYGLLFSVLALHAFSVAITRRSTGAALAAALFYALACLCKELYVPLVGVLLFWPEGDLRQRLRAAAPALVVAVGYAAWRLWLMHGIGGYVLAPKNDARSWSLLLEQGYNAVAALQQLSFGRGWQGAGALVLALVVISWGLRRGARLAWPFVLVSAAILAFPLVGVMMQQAEFDWVAGRFLLLVGWALAVLLAWQFDSVGRWWLPAALVLAVPLVVAERAAIASVFDSQPVVKAQNKFLSTAPEGAELLTQQACNIRYPDQMAQAVARLRHQPQTRVVHDLEELQTVPPARGPGVWMYDEGCNCVRQLGEGYRPLLDDFASRQAQGAGRPVDVTLGLEVTPRGRVFRWNVEGGAGATCLDMQPFARFFIPPKGEAAFGLDSTLRLDGKLRVRIVRAYTDGARVHSPILVMDIDRTNEVRWTAPVR